MHSGATLQVRPTGPSVMREWTQQIDYNLLHDPDRRTPIPAKPLQDLSRHDEHSLEAGARFIDPATGNYNVSLDSPAFQLGFANFDMRDFGVQAPELKAIARTPELPSTTRPKSVTLDSTRSPAVVPWRAQR